MSKSTDLVNELIEIARDGREFYLDAARSTLDPELKSSFEGQSDLRKRLIEDLSRDVEGHGDDASRGETIAGRTRKLYSAVVASLKKDPQGIYLEQLGEVEDRLLVRFRHVLDAVETEQLRRVLKGYLPMIEAANNQMKALSREKKAA